MGAILAKCCTAVRDTAVYVIPNRTARLVITCTVATVATSLLTYHGQKKYIRLDTIRYFDSLNFCPTPELLNETVGNYFPGLKNWAIAIAAGVEVGVDLYLYMRS